MAISTETLSQKYAKAFLEALNSDASLIKKVQQDLNELAIFSKNPLLDFFANPVFHMDEKKALIEDIFSKHKFQNETRQFVETILSLNFLHLMESIAKDFAYAVREQNRETKIEISTAYALSDEEQKQIIATFEKTVGKKVLLDVTVDRELIGGIRANVGGVVYDSSIQGHLLRLQKEFSL
ncbi:MAG: ATP synthase F1 subunit delta [Proteobacteria bacterium]|jgi:F-type H+-transporting ATPase subunit delta|nr:ATP synthase F1 subunit delta [Pseudomonadota bacterium]